MSALSATKNGISSRITSFLARFLVAKAPTPLVGESRTTKARAVGGAGTAAAAVLTGVAGGVGRDMVDELYPARGGVVLAGPVRVVVGVGVAGVSAKTSSPAPV
ncbi:hypothetical protein PWT90_09736 [Aphanocladium album]|nr:hypothetical protein PWT90_09736 [Aphanocladium album]